MTRTLIVNADDFGMSDGINRGILEAHRSGIVTSATVMTNMPAARRGIERAQREAPELGLGLHINITYGRPVRPPEEVPSLVSPDGTFVSVPQGMALSSRWKRSDIDAEVTAQLDRFFAYAGRLPDHLDAHQLVSTLSAPCRRVLLDVASIHDLPLRRGRTTWFGPFERLFPDRGGTRDALGRLLERLPRPWRQGPMSERAPRCTDGLELGFYGERATVSRLLRILDGLPSGVTELVCHPGYAEDRDDDYGYREAELAALTDPRVVARIREANIGLATFADLAASSAGAGARRIR